MPNTIATRPLGPADEALLAAELSIKQLRRKRHDLMAAGDSSDHEEITGPMADVETWICETAPDSLIGAAVKLRQLVEDIEASEGSTGDLQSARQLLALVERLIAPGAAAKPEREPFAGISLA